MKHYRKKLFYTIVIALPIFTAISCGKLDPNEIEEMAGQQFFIVELNAAADLNCIQGQPSSLMICVYQLTGRQAFDSIRDEPDCMSALLQCEKFDDSVVGRERIFINPRECKRVDFERRRGVKYLAVAAGYHNGSIAGSTQLMEMPPVTLRSNRHPPPLIGILLECDRMLRDKSFK